MSEPKPFSVFKWDCTCPARWAIDGPIGLMTYALKEEADEAAAHMNIAYFIGKEAGIRSMMPAPVAAEAEGASE